MRIGSLFSGIGGLELGLEMSGIGHTIWQVENNARLHPCLATHWPNAKRYHDVREVGATTLAPVDLICGGFPCTDISSAGNAGKRAGLAGARSGLWYEFARVVEEMRPRWVVVENVENGPEQWVDVARGALERRGYASLPIPIRASYLGAPHSRARIFIVACNPDAHCEPVESFDAEVAWMPRDSGCVPDWTKRPDLRMDDGISSGMGALGNAVVPQQAEVVGWVIRELTERHALVPALLALARGEVKS